MVLSMTLNCSTHSPSRPSGEKGLWSSLFAGFEPQLVHRPPYTDARVVLDLDIGTLEISSLIAQPTTCEDPPLYRHVWWLCNPLSHASATADWTGTEYTFSPFGHPLVVLKMPSQCELCFVRASMKPQRRSKWYNPSAMVFMRSPFSNER